jgi:hypothetical protein
MPDQSEKEDNMIHYFPSCNFTAMKPEVSERIKNYMASQGVNVLGCCRPGRKELAAGDDVVMVCETCNILVGESRPDVNCMSLYEYLDNKDDFVFPDYGGETVTIQDCYRAQNRDGEKTAARSLLKKMNFNVVELEGTAEEKMYDGEWLFREVRPDNALLAPKRFAKIREDVEIKTDEEGEAYLKAYCKRFTTDKVACYCNSCYKGLNKGGREGLHMAELLFPAD